MEEKLSLFFEEIKKQLQTTETKEHILGSILKCVGRILSDDTRQAEDVVKIAVYAFTLWSKFYVNDLPEEDVVIKQNAKTETYTMHSNVKIGDAIEQTGNSFEITDLNDIL